MTHDDDPGAEWEEFKSAVMEEFLGKEHDMVMHSMIPFALGGALDMYYYPSGIPGTAIATKELCVEPGEGSKNDVFQNYELVMFTRHPLPADMNRDESNPFGRAHANIARILNPIALYSGQAKLNPYETCEFPAEMEDIGGKCLLFDAYLGDKEDADDTFGLLLIIEIFRSEMEYARQHGGRALLELLHEAGHYPYSDLDRDPVV